MTAANDDTTAESSQQNRTRSAPIGCLSGRIHQPNTNHSLQRHHTVPERFQLLVAGNANCGVSDPDSPSGAYTSEGIGRTVTLAERIGWSHWALHNKSWIPTSDGEWGIDITRAPGQLIGLHARDNAD